MSGLNFRSRPLDNDKFLPIYMEKELPDLFESFSVNRTVPVLPSGMEKDEETEFHLQDAIKSQQLKFKSALSLIPTPDVKVIEDKSFISKIIKVPPRLIECEGSPLIDEFSNYDLDDSDMSFLNEINKKNEDNKMNLMTETELEMILEQLEIFYKGTKSDEKVLQLAKNNRILPIIFNYWQEKRRKIPAEQNIIPVIRTQDKHGQHDPHVAFRKRVEKMQTRKNRKVDEAKYEKAYKMLHFLHRYMKLIELTKIREEIKLADQINLLEIFYLRKESFITSQNLMRKYEEVLESNQVNAGVKNLFFYGMGFERQQVSPEDLCLFKQSPGSLAKVNYNSKYLRTMANKPILVKNNAFSTLFGEIKSDKPKITDIKSKERCYIPIRRVSNHVYQSRDEVIKDFYLTKIYLDYKKKLFKLEKKDKNSLANGSYET